MGDRVAVLKDGILQQCDTPRHMYDKPNNMFVAGFIGSPADEPAADRPLDGDLVHLGAANVQVRARRWTRWAPTGRSTWGFGPRTSTSSTGAGLPVEVAVVEELGADAYVYGSAEVGGERRSDHRAGRRAQAPGEGLRSAPRAAEGAHAPVPRRQRGAHRPGGVSAAPPPCRNVLGPRFPRRCGARRWTTPSVISAAGPQARAARAAGPTRDRPAGHGPSARRGPARPRRRPPVAPAPCPARGPARRCRRAPRSGLPRPVGVEVGHATALPPSVVTASTACPARAPPARPGRAAASATGTASGGSPVSSARAAPPRAGRRAVAGAHPHLRAVTQQQDLLVGPRLGRHPHRELGGQLQQRGRADSSVAVNGHARPSRTCAAPIRSVWTCPAWRFGRRGRPAARAASWPPRSARCPVRRRPCGPARALW